jgi:hypothetical protein
MPEYFMVTRVGEHFASKFANFSYHLEASVLDIIQKAGVCDGNRDYLETQPEIRLNGRFDLALFTKKRCKPVHIVEFKRGEKFESLKKDIDRLSLLADAVPAGSRLETSYLVFITKRKFNRTFADWSERLDQIVEGSLIGQNKIANNMNCSVKAVWKEPDSEHTYLSGPLDNQKPFSVIIVEIRCN